jgi:excisionase family DNA binding protein
MEQADLKTLAAMVVEQIRRTAAEPEWLPPEQAALYSGLSVKYLEAMRRDGGGPAFSRVGRLVRYSRTDLDAFMRGISHA